MLALVSAHVAHARDLEAVCLIRVFPVESRAGFGAVIETWGLGGGVVPEADGEETDAVSGAEVEGVGFTFGAEDGLLEGEDGGNGSVHGFDHFGGGIVLLERRGVA